MTVSNWARRLNFRARRRLPRAAALPPLILVSDPQRLPDPERATARLPRGSAVLLRVYGMPARAEIAQRIARICRRRRLRLLIAGDDRLAEAVRADGIHYSEAVARRRRIQPTGGCLTTVACHDGAALRRAATRGADACLLSPVFNTESHPGARPLGPWRFATLVRSVTVPVYALGGVNHRTARRLVGSGACGIAAIGALSGANP